MPHTRDSNYPGVTDIRKRTTGSSANLRTPIRPTQSYRSVVALEGSLVQIEYQSPRPAGYAEEYVPDELLTAAIHDSPVATIIVDSGHRVRRFNCHAGNILDRCDSFIIDNGGRLRAANGYAQPSFYQYLADMLAQPEAVQLGISTKYLLSRPPLQPVSVIAVTWKANGATGRQIPCWAILYLRDPSILQLPADDDLRAWFGFTKAESQLACAIVSGRTIKQYSSDRGVSLNTLKTQFQSILDKTRVHRQVDLVRLLSSL